MNHGSALTVAFVFASMLLDLPPADAGGSLAAASSVITNGPRITIVATIADGQSCSNYTALRLLLRPKPAEDISGAKAAGEGLVAIRQAVVTAGTDCLRDSFYVQSVAAPVGIGVAVDTASLVEPILAGYQVAIDGNLTTIHGELQVRATNVSVLERRTRAPSPIGIGIRDLGGAGPARSRLGQLSVGTGAGANNVGLLVRVWGTVTRTTPGCFYISCAAPSGDSTEKEGAPGLEALVACEKPGEFSPGDYVSVTGVVSCFVDSSGHLAPRILTRSDSDVVRYPNR